MRAEAEPNSARHGSRRSSDPDSRIITDEVDVLAALNICEQTVQALNFAAITDQELYNLRSCDDSMDEVDDFLATQQNLDDVVASDLLDRIVSNINNLISSLNSKRVEGDQALEDLQAMYDGDDGDNDAYLIALVALVSVATVLLVIVLIMLVVNRMNAGKAADRARAEREEDEEEEKSSNNNKARSVMEPPAPAYNNNSRPAYTSYGGGAGNSMVGQNRAGSRNFGQQSSYADPYSGGMRGQQQHQQPRALSNLMQGSRF